MILEPNTVIAALKHELEHEPVPAEQRRDGAPHTGSVVLAEFGGTTVGIWEMTPGVMTDIESDEIFIVLSGAARVDFTDDRSSVDIGPGYVGRFAAGTATVWTVTETLRKVYLA